MNSRGVEQVPAIVRELYETVARLEAIFPGRRFTLDGHLVGSVGEVLAADRYELDLLEASAPIHDATASDGRQVQIKATQRSSIGLRAEPDYLVVLQLRHDGDAEEVYSGPGALPWKQAGKLQRNGQRVISVARLKILQTQVPENDRIPQRR